jgi:hypothetical protein
MTARLSILLMLACSASVAGGPADVRAAQFYAAGLERPLLQLRNGALLIQACKQPLSRACSREQRELAAGDGTIELLDALTLFPQRPARSPADGITRPAELTGKIGATSADLLREAGEYDRQLFARYGAVLRVDRRVANQTPSFEFGAPKKPAPEVPPEEIAFAVAGNFVSVVATELQLTVFPESEARIRAVGEQVTE